MMTATGLAAGGSLLAKVDRLRVMVVDDHDETRWVIRTILVAFGVQRICEASSAADALKKMKAFQPDLLLVDYQMPEMDGLELVRRMRVDRHDPFVPVILMTSEATPGILAAARDAGANEFLAKPITPVSLRARLNAVILKPRNFISNKVYFGPDRRRRQQSHSGLDRRSVDAGPPELAIGGETGVPDGLEREREQQAESLLQDLEKGHVA